ncbi:MAG TPA: hypothetical protein VN923_14130, partial [Thermoanaerobaculia bacterium]|nr:hypothetical protein [Thermoanaerobaculia bacterium]
RASFAALLEAGEEGTKIAAARGLLAMGPGPEDKASLQLVVDGPADASVLPACLAKRKDLVPDLLAQPGKARSWGFLLASRFPRAAPLSALAAAVRDELPPAELVGSMLKALRKIRDPRLAEGLLDLYLEAPADYRGTLAPLMVTHKNELRELLAKRDVDDEARLILAAHLGLAARDVVAHIVEIDGHEARLRVLNQVATQEDLVRQLPWAEWLAERPDLYAGLAARVAAEFSLRDLVPPLRAQLGQRPNPDLIRAVGELGDRESVPVLLGLLESGPSAAASPRNLVPLVLESLGRVGGPEARQAIRRAILDGRCDPRIGYRALSLCAIEEDDALFRRAVGHPDWYVRLACADVLGRFVRPENLAALSQLAADPVGIVSQRALSFLEA